MGLFLGLDGPRHAVSVARTAEADARADTRCAGAQRGFGRFELQDAIDLAVLLEAKQAVGAPQGFERVQVLLKETESLTKVA